MKVTATKASFKKYPTYKGSGVEWLGDIPVHWEINPGLKFILENKSKNSGMVRNTVLSLSYGKIRVKEKDELTGLVPESFETYQLVNRGDLIFRPTDLQNDKVSLRSAYSEYDGIITNAYLNLKFKKIADSKFFHYFFRAIDNNKIIYGLGSGLRQNISYLDFRRFLFPFPPLQEQTLIAKFLDEKTAKIDRAIAQKEKMIALLKERKQIIIQNAVTKGLNPNAKMKDSGVEWIGEIPEDWEVKKMSYVAKIETGGTPDRSKSSFWNGTIPWVKTGEVNYQTIVETEEYITDSGIKNSSTRLAPAGTLLMAMYGQGVTRGRVSLLGIAASYNQACCAMLFKKSINNVYAYFYFIAAYKYIRDDGNETSQMNISSGYISTLKILIPPYNEQSIIVAHIKEQSAKIDKAIKLQEQQIEKLIELKATLIDGAVTGKIKVS